VLFALSKAASLCRLQKLDDSALFLAGNISAETHVMNDYIPLSVAVHGGRSNIVAAQAIVRPKLFACEAHVGIAETAPFDSVSVFRFALGSASRFQLVLAKSRSKAERRPRLSLVSIGCAQKPIAAWKNRAFLFG
jgi:hypothetical protein